MADLFRKMDDWFRMAWGMKNFNQEKLVMELREGSIQYRDETHPKESNAHDSMLKYIELYRKV